MGYDDIRKSLDGGFSVDTLNEITRLGHDLLASDRSLQHPCAVYAVAVTAQKLVALIDSQQFQEQTIALIEAHIKPKIAAVLDVADGNADALVQALDDLARGYSEAGALLK